MTLVTIEGFQRRGTGKSACRAIRRQGRIPANILGKNHAQPMSIELETKLLPKAWAADKTFQLSFEGKLRSMKIHELQLDPVRREPLHVDLVEV